ncbi:MAG TPA: cation:proton antiporter [Haliscomenobacter sp.]|uniref:cation:proton antiporter domain-containing protein n=1 Tax=Haliscomenobacter sp. TaxID=2717303 RepID=UPI002C35895A|nr:cation:proton antiporter [Haliscomenobacter sp.]HOY19837.1 cation:proton antiporter [Haliscomenobacter sp.]
MPTLSPYQAIIALCSLVIASYLFTWLNRATRIPSVLLLLGLGIALHLWAGHSGVQMQIPAAFIEVFGTIGLIMIVLEAGLDLSLNKDKGPLIQRSFFSALVIFLVSTASVSAIVHLFFPEASVRSCVVYAIPLSIISSAIVLPSVHHLSEHKKEFLIYEASFSDIIGIMVFNYFATDTDLTWGSLAWFGVSIVVSIVLSIVVCLLLMWLLIHNQLELKFFLFFAVLTMIYIGGKILHLPSLIAVMAFGLVVNNWGGIKMPWLQRQFNIERVEPIASLLQSITGETSFLIRTVFFVIFGYSIELNMLLDPEVLKVGGAILAILLVLRFSYLRFLHRQHLLPELFYIPRGLITVLLFYRIPEMYKLEQFSEGILFFLILSTGLILMLGALFYHDRPQDITHNKLDN